MCSSDLKFPKSKWVFAETGIGSVSCVQAACDHEWERRRLWTEGIVTLDEPIDSNGRTLRQLLSHAGGYAFDGETPIAAPESRRIYSNTGIEHAAEAVAEAAGMPFEHYLRESLLEPLGMQHTVLKGSPAHQMFSTLDDLLLFVRELRAPDRKSTRLNSSH